MALTSSLPNAATCASPRFSIFNPFITKSWPSWDPPSSNSTIPSHTAILGSPECLCFKIRPFLVYPCGMSGKDNRQVDHSDGERGYTRIDSLTWLDEEIQH